MPSWQGQSKGTPLGYRIFVQVLRSGGTGPAYFLLRFVTFYYFLFSRKTSGPILSFYQRLGYGRVKALGKLYRNYFMLGQSLIDRIVLMSGLPNRFSFDFDGEQHLVELGRLQRGGLLLSAHVGNWEIAGHLLKRLDIPIHIVMFDNEHERIKNYLSSVTGERQAHIIVIRDGFSHLYEINDALKRNELVCMHADRFLEGNKTRSAEFLGSPAAFPAGPFVLAAGFRIPVSFVFAVKESNLHYHFFASPVQQPQTERKEEYLDGLFRGFVQAMETMVRKYPEQWFNYYDFWKQP